MPIAKFDAPAFQDIEDFAGHDAERQTFESLWNRNVDAWTNQAIAGPFYYNPLTEPVVPPPRFAARVPWVAFPNRVTYYFENAGFSQRQMQEFADNGTVDGVEIPAIPNAGQVCADDSTPTIPYGPYGPRGWQDEYCEWSVTRNSAGKIVRVDFTCENPEYWFAVWQVSPDRVVELYNETLASPYRSTNVTLGDLILTYQGNSVIDPATRMPAYNPLNKWNSGPRSVDGSGGAMHLTSTPNSLQTELGLAGIATLRYPSGSSSDPNTLLCCADFGQPHRNSDPTIGYQANQVVLANNKITVANPPGLYIQRPSFTGWVTPDGTPAAEFWRVTRGKETLPEFNNPQFNFILHAVYEVPLEKGYTVSDITISGQPILWASQIAQTFQVALYPLPIQAQNNQPVTPCVDPDAPCENARPVQLMYVNLWTANYGTYVPNPRNFPMSLASNTIIVPIEVGRTAPADLAMICSCAALGPNGELPSVFFSLPGSSTPDPNITVTVRYLTNVFYAIPGNSYPSENQMLQIQVNASAAALGPRDAWVANAGQPAGSMANALVIV